MAPVTKTVIRIGIATGVAILLFQAGNLFLVYHYFKFDYYLAAVAVIFLVAGILISRSKSPAVVTTPNQPGPLHELTLKEMQVLKLIAEGKTNKEIADQNFVELSTIKTHINNIYNKLGVSNRKEAIRLYQAHPPALT